MPQDDVQPDSGRIAWIPASSWILYDLANTIYAGAITYVVAPYFKNTFTYISAFGITQTVTMIASGLVMPIIASICDRTAQTRLYLTLFTALCIGSMFGWAVWTTEISILIFLAIGNFSYQNALVFYNALLPSVAPTEKAGLISGLGVGLGYAGTIVTILIALTLHQFGFGFQAICGACAALFLILALPCLLIVKEKRHIDRRPLSLDVVRERGAALWTTIRQLPHNRVVLLFFIGNFFLVDVLNTAILYFATFTENVFQLQADRGELILLGHQFDSAQQFAMIMGIVLCSLALVFGSLSGYMSDRIHPLRVVRGSGWCLLLGLAGAIFAGGKSPFLYMVALCGAGSFGLAGIWTAGRKVLLLVAPKEDIAQYFGLYGITLKLSVVGSTTFALIADAVLRWQMRRVSEDLALELSQKYAIGFQLIQLLLGLGVLYAIRTRDVPENGAADAVEL